MATARRRWFKVADRVAREPWDNDTLAGAIRLMAYLHTRWARDGLDPDEASRAAIRWAEVQALTGKGRRDVAATSLERLAEVLEISVERHADFALIEWPKFPIFQGMTTREQGNRRPGTGHLPAPSASRITQPLREEHQADAKGGGAGGGIPAAPQPAPPGVPKPARKRREQLDPLPPGFPDAMYRVQLEAEFQDLDVAAAIDEFLAYAEAKPNTARYAGERGWRAALRGALLRDRSKGLFVRRSVPARRTADRADELASIARGAGDLVRRDR